MLRASVGGEKPLLIMGISDGNVERLKAGYPIKTPFKSYGYDIPGDIFLFYGKTEADMEAMFRKEGLIDEETPVVVDHRLDQEAKARSVYDHILIGTVGLPRSGKTTWARSQAYPIVNPDSIRLAIHGQRFVAEAEPFVWATAKAMVRALFLAGHKHVILDATNTTRKRRDEWMTPWWGTFWKVIDTSHETCLERAKDDQEIIPVINRMKEQWEPLADCEQRW